MSSFGCHLAQLMKFSISVMKLELSDKTVRKKLSVLHTIRESI